jgi:signal transduction histidine kinase
MRAPGLRLYLALVAAAVAAATTALLLLLGLPLVARGSLTPATFVALVLGGAILGAGAGALLLARVVARPIERLLAAAAALGRRGPADLPLLGEDRGLALPRASVAFERLAVELDAERTRLAAKVDELTRANAALAEARESLVRSEKLATVGRLAAGLAHEVGNPLGAIAGYVELARGRVPPGADPELADSIDRIGAAAERIDRTVRDLLEFARPAPLALAPMRLARAVEATLRLARVQSRFRGVAVEVDVPEHLPLVLADERHVSQVLLNLLLNAGDATGGRGNVRVDAHVSGDHVVLSVEDDGPGIAPGDLVRIFDPFFTTKNPGEGTGLGLSISHRLVEALGGEIEAGRRPGGGAVFRVRLRVASPAGEEPR